MLERARSDGRLSRAQASVELLAALPILALALLLAAQLALAGYALWSAGLAARAGVRAAEVGRDASGSARRALPSILRADARVAGDERVRVEVFVPRLVPWLPRLPLEASASLHTDERAG